MPLGIVPLGTGNLLAATLGIPRDPMVAAKRLATAKPVTIDTGKLQVDGVDERFAVAAGLGFDARLMQATSPAAKARFGVLAYFATMAKLVAALPVARAEIVVDGRTYESTVAVLVANCGQVVPGLLGPRVTLDPTDGVLDLIAIRGGPWLTKLPIAARSALHSLLRDDTEPGGHSLRLRGERITVKTDPQADRDRWRPAVLHGRNVQSRDRAQIADRAGLGLEAQLRTRRAGVRRQDREAGLDGCLAHGLVGHEHLRAHPFELLGAGDLDKPAEQLRAEAPPCHGR